MINAPIYGIIITNKQKQGYIYAKLTFLSIKTYTLYKIINFILPAMPYFAIIAYIQYNVGILLLFFFLLTQHL